MCCLLLDYQEHGNALKDHELTSAKTSRIAFAEECERCVNVIEYNREEMTYRISRRSLATKKGINP